MRSFSVRYGVDRVFVICVGLLCLCYVLGIMCAWSMQSGVWRLLGVTFHAALLFLVIGRARHVDLERPSNIWAYYMFIWRLFYLEYFIVMLTF